LQAVINFAKIEVIVKHPFFFLKKKEGECDMRLGLSVGGGLLSSLHLKIAHSLWGFQLIPSDSTG